MLSFPARSMEKVLQKLHELVPHHEAQHPPGISNEKLKEQHDNMVIPKHGPNMSPGLKKLKLRFLKVRFSFWTLHTDIQFMDPWSETLNKIPKSFIIIFHQKEHLIYIIFYHIPRQKKTCYGTLTWLWALGVTGVSQLRVQFRRAPNHGCQSHQLGKQQDALCRWYMTIDLSRTKHSLWCTPCLPYTVNITKEVEETMISSTKRGDSIATRPLQ